MANFGLIELGFVFGIVLAVAIWELYLVRKGLDKRANDKGDDKDRS